jgi:hypothetical protein
MQDVMQENATFTGICREINIYSQLLLTFGGCFEEKNVSKFVRTDSNIQVRRKKKMKPDKARFRYNSVQQSWAPA